MIKLMFKPVSVIGGILAGLIGKKAFEAIWAALARREAPDPRRRETAWRALIPALLLEGAIFRAVRGVVDHGSRRWFSSLTGRWPGEDRPRSD